MVRVRVNADGHCSSGLLGYATFKRHFLSTNKWYITKDDYPLLVTMPVFKPGSAPRLKHPSTIMQHQPGGHSLLDCD